MNAITNQKLSYQTTLYVTTMRETTEKLREYLLPVFHFSLFIQSTRYFLSSQLQVSIAALEFDL